MGLSALANYNSLFQMKKIIFYLFLVSFYLPLYWLLIFVSYVFRVTNEIGRLPEYDNPQSGMFPKHFDFVGNSLNIIALMSLLTLIVLLFNLYFKFFHFRKSNIYLWFIGIISIVLLFVLNPIDLMRWFLD